MKPIDADKLLYFLANEDIADVKDAHGAVLDGIERGLFEVDQKNANGPIRIGDKVKHIDARMKSYGIGIVLNISLSGERALVDWPDYDKEKLPWQPTRSYFRIDKLLLLGESSSKEIAE